MKAGIIDQNTAETIKLQNFTIECQAKDLKDQIKKNILMSEFIKQPEKMAKMLNQLINCPTCKKTINDFLESELNKSCDKCIYRNECKNELNAFLCPDFMESVV